MSNKTVDPTHRQLPTSVKVVVWLMRIVIGATFAFSGFVKAIDPWGTYYKAQDYLMALGWEQLFGLSLLPAFTLPAIELMLGVAVVVGAYRRGVPVALLAVLALMLPLTLWLALTDAVPDCGCFGDVLVLSNLASFFKNVLLASGAVFLLLVGRNVRGLYGPAVQWMVMAVTFVAVMVIAFHGYFTQPLLDFRPYPIGTRLVSASPTTDDTSYLFIYEKDGQRQEFSIDSLPDEDNGWTFVDRIERRHEANETASVPAARALAVTDHGTDAADELLDNERLLLLLFPDLPDVSIATTFSINELVEDAQTHGVAVYGLTSASDGQMAEWADISMARYPMLVADETDIKMMARGNPAVIYVKEGTIAWKRTLESISDERIRDPLVSVDTLSDDMHPGKTLSHTLTAWLVIMAVILLVNRTHLVVRPLLNKKQSNPTKHNKQ